jgi:hypothetical protein
MSNIRPEGFIGQEWEVDQRLRYGSVSGVVNATSYLQRVSLEPGMGSTRVVFLRHARPLLSGSVTLDPELDAAGFEWGWVLSGHTFFTSSS